MPQVWGLGFGVWGLGFRNWRMLDLDREEGSEPMLGLFPENLFLLLMLHLSLL